MSLPALRFTTAKLLANALCDLFPGTQLVQSRVSDVDFYYDVILQKPIAEDALPMIEDRMRELIRQALPIQILEMMRQNAVALLLHHKQPLKAELAAAAKSNIINIVQIDHFYDYSPGPYLESTDQIGAIKLLSLNNIEVTIPEIGSLEVTRIHGTAFSNSQELKKHLKRFEKAKSLDHRLLGPQLQLFKEFSNEWGWLPKGVLLRSILINSIGSPPQCQPFDCLSDQQTICLSHQPVAERQLPLNFQNQIKTSLSEENLEGFFITPSQEELLRYTLCSEEQLPTQLISSLQFIEKFIKMLGLEYQWYLCKNQKRAKEDHSNSFSLLEQALKEAKLDYTVEKRVSEGASQVELRLADAMGRFWKGPYVMIDLHNPGLQELRYFDQQGTLKKPAVVKSSLLGPLERFAALLVEHFSGFLPLWLAPEQIRVVPTSEKYADYAETICREIARAGFRGSIDERPLPLGERIHQAELERIPYFVIVGDKENRSKTITVRPCNTGKLQSDLTLEQFLRQLQDDK